MSKQPFREGNHRVHDYAHLVKRWRAIARGAGLKLEEFAQQDEYPLFCLRTRHAPDAGGLYVSAGIHGDEPAGPEALAQWAERHLATRARAKLVVPLFILPCLNPWGLVHNRRSDHQGRDLNRLFDRRISPLKELRGLLTGYRFDLALHLHEDYDGQGAYLYEINHGPARWGADLLQACTSRAVPVEPRRRIDDWRFRDGLLAEDIDLNDVPEHPEALHLYLHHCQHACTFETPSEFGLAHRVRAHVRLIERCLERLGHPERPEQLETKKGAKKDFQDKLKRRVLPTRRHG